MNYIVMTQYSGAFLGPIAKLLGFLINWIFEFLNYIHIPSIGLAIILFTIVIYSILLPLTIKQQKFSKLSAKMNPEIQAIQAKYKNKKDTESMQKQNEELQAVYAKYGVSPTGSCLQLAIQMPILFALYRVIYNIPAYIPRVKDTLLPLANKIFNYNSTAATIADSNIAELSGAKLFLKSVFNTDSIVDVLNKCSSADWDSILNIFPDVTDITNKCHDAFLSYNTFLGMNITDSPSYMLSTGWASKSFLLIIAALSIPVLAAVTQWLNVLFMPQANTGDSDNAMAASMKSMNIMMPVMSAVFCFTLPAGMGLYWIASAVVRSIQQVVINKHIDKIDLDKLIEKNLEKNAKKIEKNNVKSGGVTGNTLKNSANIKTKNISSDNGSSNSVVYKKGSLSEKANLVKKYNDNK